MAYVSNLSPSHRPPQPSLNNGPVQRRVRRAFVATGQSVLSTTQIMDWSHPRPGTTQQRNAYDRQNHRQHRNDVEQDDPRLYHRKTPSRLSPRVRRIRPSSKPSQAGDSAPFLPTPTSHSAVRRISARARHEDADQCRVSNWRAFPNRLLPELPGSDQERAISAMQ